ncbi:MAG: amino acid ABC transporter permease, partial [Pseudomonadota bacterium]
MQSKSSKWIGHGIYVLIMAMLIGAVYFSGKSINYNWHWDRLWPYVVNTEMQQLRANGDGTAVVNAGQLTIEFDDSSQSQVIDHYTTLLVGNGDLVFQGDTVAQLNEWKFGPIAHGLWVTVKIS